MELPKLEKFNAFETENADIWVQRYELMCEFSKWDEVQATRAFTCFIDNYALAWYMLLDAEDRNSKDKLFRKFKERFGRKSIEKVGLWKDAADLKQKQNETVSQFISRIERLCFLSGQTVMMEQFILRGLRPEFVVPFVTATGLKQNFSVSEAIDAALLADITMQIVSKPEPVEITSAIKDNHTPQNQPRSDGKCDTYCHNYEHFENAHLNVPPVNVLNHVNRQQKRPQIKGFRKTNSIFYPSSAKSNPSHHLNKVRQSRNKQSKQNIVNLFANTRCSRADCKINVRIGSSVIHTLVDTGAAVSVINTKTYQSLQVDKLYPVDKSDLLGVRGVNDHFIRVLGKVTLPVEIGKLTLFHDFYILDDVNMPLILGRDFMHDQKAEISFPKQVLSLQNGMTEVSLSQGQDRDRTHNFVRALSDVTFQPRERVIFPVKIDNFSENTSGIIEPNFSLAGKHNIMGARCLIQTHNNNSVFEILNPTNAVITLKQNTIVGNFVKIQDDKVFGELKQNFEFINSIRTGEALNLNNNYIKIATEMGIDLTKSDLSETQKYQLLTLLGQYRQAFAKDITELGCTKIGKHIIDTGDANPVRQFPYRTTPKTKEEINTHLDEMEEQGIIRKRMSPWSSPILLVAEPNGEKRVCVDYRKLNRLTKIYTQSLPNLSDVLDTLGEKQAQTYSVCDMRQGFWQLELDEQSKEKTAFMTHRGQYEFNRLPYGLANSPATFNMIMNEVIRDLNWKSALVYVDDILIYSKNFEEHLCHLAALFDKLIEANLKLKPSKCQFACKEVQYLGHIITKEGIAVDPEKTTSVHSFAAPKNVKEVRMFLGLCNYYRKFIHNYSKITSPLNQLLHKDQQFKWTDECQRSLEILKTKLTSAPILVFPDFNKEFILHTDASGTAIGYVLGQHDKDKKPELLRMADVCYENQNKDGTLKTENASH
ncbi:Retrovirus-related Pol polyprotein from transposon 297 [Mytilus coruscus]|uniref:Retrovirus-related Pol polyprotein from transposon 297 n=1 Tax=Mytilus coruscus TaxID=42192 RepID=A0A6J8EW75_MYTCO|nr:Retrovirus-related Pol polyprotein from transposon 297 [Mytilus coruscus]